MSLLKKCCFAKFFSSKTCNCVQRMITTGQDRVGQVCLRASSLITAEIQSSITTRAASCLSSLPLLPPGIPLVCFLVLLPLNIPWSQISVTWLGVVHFLACLSPQLGSVLYHLFMNHEGGEPVYHTLLKLDVCGICMINTLGKPPYTPLSRFRGPLSFLHSLLLCLL